jgi:hypothetical protein
MRAIALLLLGLTLTGCLTTDEPAPQANAPAAQPSAATPAVTAPPSDKPAQRRAAPAAARGASAPAVPQSTDLSPDAVLEVRQICWAEGNKLRSLTTEARADFVNKCVADNSKALGLYQQKNGGPAGSVLDARHPRRSAVSPANEITSSSPGWCPARSGPG